MRGNMVWLFPALLAMTMVTTVTMVTMVTKIAMVTIVHGDTIVSMIY